MKIPILTVILAMSTSALYFVAGAMPENLMWHHGETHQVWQWLSAHFVHISSDHLVWNVVALIVLGGIIERSSRTALCCAILAGIVGVNVFLATMYSLNAYAGLSGLLNSLLVVSLYLLYQQPGYKLASAITLLLSIAKIALEVTGELSLFSSLPWPSVPQAHLAGLIAGCLAAIWLHTAQVSTDQNEFAMSTPD